MERHANTRACDEFLIIAKKHLFCYHISTMYAIIETGGKQYWVVPGEILQVERLTAKAGEDVTFKALWTASQEEKNAATGKSPEAKVTATVVRHLRGDKMIIFRKRPKKAYEKSSGHRQELTELQVKEIHLS